MRGEIVVVVAGRSDEEAQAGAPDYAALAAQLAAGGLSVRDLRARLMTAGLSKNEAYALALQAGKTPLPGASPDPTSPDTLSSEDLP